MLRRTTILSFFLLCSAETAFSQTAGMLSFQGLLKDLSGVPISGSVTLQFRIYTAQSDGTLVDMDGDGVIENTVGQDVKQVVVNATNGVASTKFGPIHPKAFDGTVRWLELTVNGSAMPRIEMATAPATSERVNVPGTGTSAIYVASNGKVGIGTTNPQAPFHLEVPSVVPGTEPFRISSTTSGRAIRLHLDQGGGSTTINFTTNNFAGPPFLGTWDVGVADNFNSSGQPAFYIGRAATAQDLAIYPDRTTELRKLRVIGGLGVTDDPLFRVDGKAEVNVLKINGGSDLAEPFNVAPETNLSILPGMVVVIDPDRSGELKLARESYDRKVAGIISGANGLSPGMIMKAEGQPHANGEHPVALTGRVWCWCDASLGTVEPGDRLTTSATAGHAMKVTDESRAAGAVIGKAMSPLAQGKGLVLVLVQPQ
ncbi:MAG TPA: hypothetical protein VNT79_00730 [Phycisphaerae bacterium]|nr:hypothetical protein [Phycisphaerae bacterium]